MAIRPFLITWKNLWKRKNAQKNVEKVAIDINMVLKGQKCLFMKSVFVHDYDQTYHETAE